ncbi:MAG TPA: hypothetical protein VI564_05555 [Candidatus Nanoarchaeia archaeon]|nr:hypothetical protein [Candidatus Nanoarchaeia archaeon]
MRRRTFIVGAISGVIGIGTGSYFYLNNENMGRAPVREGKILFDGHNHPSSGESDEKTLEMLCSPGIAGLAHKNEERGKILTYETVLKRFSDYVEEIDKGIFAKITTQYGTGYFTRTQEISGGRLATGANNPHILAVGFEGEYLKNSVDARKTVDEIHKRGGIAIMNHPYITNGGMIYRTINAEEERIARELLEIVDEVEIFNATAINPTLGIGFENMKPANEKAKRLIEGTRFKGIVSTDSHSGLEQPKKCGIYVDAHDIDTERLKFLIKSGKFDNDLNCYIIRWSLLKGVLGF